MTTSLYSLGEKLFVVCAGPRLLLARTGDTYLLSLGFLLVRLTLQSPCKGNLLLTTSPPSTWGPTRGEKYIHQIGIKQISGAVAGDSSVRDRGVAHYLLPLLFSLVSLLFMIGMTS